MHWDLEGSQGSFLVLKTLQNGSESDHLKHTIYFRTRIEQLEMFLDAGLTRAVY